MNYRKYLKDKCEHCNIDNIILLLIHHIDRDRENNNPSNLQTLCYNCHRLVHWEHRNGLKNKLPEIYEDGNMIECIFPNPIKNDDFIKRFIFLLGHRKGNELFLNKKDEIVGFRCFKEDFDEFRKEDGTK